MALEQSVLLSEPQVLQTPVLPPRGRRPYPVRHSVCNLLIAQIPQSPLSEVPGWRRTPHNQPQPCARQRQVNRPANGPASLPPLPRLQRVDRPSISLSMNLGTPKPCRLTWKSPPAMLRAFYRTRFTPDKPKRVRNPFLTLPIGKIGYTDLGEDVPPSTDQPRNRLMARAMSPARSLPASRSTAP